MDAYEQIQSSNPRGVQNNRPLKLDTPAGKDVLVPLRAVGHSRIGRGYAFTVDMVSTSRKLELKQLIAQPVTLWMRQNDKTYKPHHGYVHTVRRLGMGTVGSSMRSWNLRPGFTSCAFVRMPGSGKIRQSSTY